METIKSNEGLNIEKMGRCILLSHTIKLRDGTNFTPSFNDSDRKTFGVNNDFMSFATEDGRYYFTKCSPEKVRELQDAGYKNQGLGVPFSNGECPLEGTSDYDAWCEIALEKTD